MYRKLISIIIPCFNYGQYLPECVASCLAQTYSPFEIIIVDDGSTDAKTIDVIRTIKKENPDIVTIVRIHNQGPAAARNRGIGHAKGEYIVFLDADDLLDPAYLSETYTHLENHPKAAYCYTWSQKFGDVMSTWWAPDYDIPTLLIIDITAVTTLIKRRVFQSFQFDTHVKYHEDWDFWITLAEHKLYGVCLHKVLFYYRQHRDSRFAHYWQDPQYIFKAYRELFQKHKEFYVQYLPDTLVFAHTLYLQKNETVVERFVIRKLIKRIVHITTTLIR